MNFSSRSVRQAFGFLTLSVLSAASILSVVTTSNAQSQLPVPTSPSTQSPSQAGWKNFRSPEGRFTIMLPQEPVKTSEKDADGDVTYTYKVESGENVYAVSHVDIANLKQLAQSDVQNILQTMPAEIVKAMDSKLVRNRSIALRKNPGQEFDFLMTVEGKQFEGQGRIYAIGTRVYTLLYIGNPTLRSRFINSFDVI
jgi:spermidine/putrescine-binding protein